MTPYEKNLAEHRRLSVLKVLVKGGGFSNESILKDAVEEVGLGAGLTREVMREDLKFLEERAAIKIEWVGDTLAVAHITVRGVDIATGRILVEGIKRPSIGV
jgi:hypothetical protein